MKPFIGIVSVCGFTLLAAGPCGPQGASPAPLKSIHGYLCGLHFVNGEPNRQVVAHHYCAHLSADLRQCVIYDSNRKDARLIGIEYVVSAKLFQTLPAEEKRLWHSHAYEVKSGLLVAPGLAGTAERAAMRDLATTYGKTWHTWQVDRGDAVPMGMPQLMMGLTADGQANPQAVAARDQELGVTTEAKRRQRADLPDPPVDPEANAWERGPALQLELKPQGPPKVFKIPLH